MPATTTTTTTTPATSAVQAVNHITFCWNTAVYVEARCDEVTAWSHQHGFPHVDDAPPRLHPLDKTHGSQAIPHVDARFEKHACKTHIGGTITHRTNSNQPIPNVSARFHKHTLKANISGIRAQPKPTIHDHSVCVLRRSIRVTRGIMRCFLLTSSSSQTRV